MEETFRPHVADEAGTRSSWPVYAIVLVVVAATGTWWIGADVDLSGYERTLPLVLQPPLATDARFVLGVADDGVGDVDVDAMHVIASVGPDGSGVDESVTFTFDRDGEARPPGAFGTSNKAPLLVLAFRRDGEEGWESFTQLAPSAEQVAAWSDGARYFVRVPERFATEG